MVDIATLGLAVDSRPVADASKDLDRISAAAKKAEDATSGFGKRAEDAGRRAAAANDNVARSANKVTAAYDKWHAVARRVATAVGAIAGAFSVASLTRYADQWSDMQSRVGAAIKDMEAAPVLMRRIVDIANASYSPLAQTVEIYGRNVAVLRDLGRGAVEAADFTEALNHALVTTATKGQDADVVLNALSRAIATGKLRTMEFETIMSRSPRVLEAVADELGTNVNGLLAMAKAGKVTGDVIVNALINNLEKLRAEAAEMPATIGDAFVRIQTNLVAFVGQLDKTAGASETVAGALLTLADNIGRVVTYAATAVTAFGTYYVAAMVAAYVSTMTLSGALVLLRGALIRTGIGVLIVGAGELVYQFGRLVAATGSLSGALEEVGRRAVLALDGLKFAFFAVTESIRAAWYDTMANLLRATENAFGAILRLFGISAEQISASIDDLTYRADNMRKAAELSASIARGQFGEALAPITIPEGTVSDDALPSYRPPADLDDAAKKAADAYKRLVDGAKEFIAAQELERSVIGMTEEAANALRYEFGLLAEAQRAGINLTPEMTAQLQGLARGMAAAEAATRKLQEAFDFAKDVTKGFFSDIMQGLRDGEGLWRSFADAAANALQKIADKLLDMALDQAINGFLRSIMGAFGGGLGGGFPSAPSVGVGLYHTGGIAGHPSMQRSVNPAIFMNAPRYHNGGIAGLRPGEVPAILQRGERIIPANANHSNDNQLTINVNVSGARGNAEIEEMVYQGVASGLSKFPQSKAFQAGVQGSFEKLRSTRGIR